LFAAAGTLTVAAIVLTISFGLSQPEEALVIEGHATFRTVPSLEVLTREASLVVVGSVVGDGQTRMVLPIQPPAQAPVSPASVLQLPDAKRAGASTGDAAAAPPSAPPGQPVTAFNVRVERTLKGTVKAGSMITVMQLGGAVSVPGVGRSRPQVLQFEHDPLMARDEEHVLFLAVNDDGTYAFVGGDQGRFRVDRAGRIHPLNRQAPTGRNQSGKTVDDLANLVGAAEHTTRGDR
jgi:hypothetical protein